MTTFDVAGQDSSRGSARPDPIDHSESTGAEVRPTPEPESSPGSHEKILDRRLAVLEEAVEQLTEALRESERVAEGYRIEALARRDEVAELELERDTARVEADAHAESAQVVSSVSEQLVERWRGEVDDLRRSLEGSRSSEDRLRVALADLTVLVESLTIERDLLQSRFVEVRDFLDEVEGSRAWRAVTAYRTLRLLLPHQDPPHHR
ncbi:MAG: hypothetical protein ACLQRH_29150 [Acidimicrobiales bacterium]